MSLRFIGNSSVGNVACIDPCMLRRYDKESYHVYIVVLSLSVAAIAIPPFAGTGCVQVQELQCEIWISLVTEEMKSSA